MEQNCEFMTLNVKTLFSNKITQNKKNKKVTAVGKRQDNCRFQSYQKSFVPVYFQLFWDSESNWSQILTVVSELLLKQLYHS